MRLHEFAVECMERDPFGEKLKPWTSKIMPNFEEIVKTFEHDAPLTKQAQLRFRLTHAGLGCVESQ